VIDTVSLTLWDWFLAGALLISVLLGLLSGMVRTVFALAGWLVGFLGAPILTPVVLEATGWSLHPYFVMGMLFFLLLVVIRLGGAALSRLMSSIGLGGLDRTLGALLGVARALLVVGVAAVIGHQFDAHERPAWKQAISRPLLDEFVALSQPLLPTAGGGASARLRRI
jgi:membrane protein required for colicin V production